MKWFLKIWTFNTYEFELDLNNSNKKDCKKEETYDLCRQKIKR